MRNAEVKEDRKSDDDSHQARERHAASLEQYRRHLPLRALRAPAARSVLPFRRTARNRFHPAGRMALIKAVLDNRLPLSAIFTDRLATCTSCLACEAACPSNVPVTAIIQAAKEQAVRASGRASSAASWPQRSRMTVPCAPCVARAGGAAVRKGSEGRHDCGLPGLVRERPGSGGDAECGSEKEKSTGSKGRIAFYPGCAIKHFQPDIGTAAVAVLERAGYEVVVLDDAACCGRPLLSLGDREAAQAVAEQNQRALCIASGGPRS